MGRQVEQDLAFLKIDRHPLKRAQLAHAQQHRGFLAEVELFERRGIGEDHWQVGEIEVADGNPAGEHQVGHYRLAGHRSQAGFLGRAAASHRALQRAVADRALRAGIDHHIGLDSIDQRVGHDQLVAAQARADNNLVSAVAAQYLGVVHRDQVYF